MTLAQAMIALIPATGLIIVALINLRPKKASPEQFMSEELKRMSDRIGDSKKATAKCGRKSSTYAAKWTHCTPSSTVSRGTLSPLKTTSTKPLAHSMSAPMT